MSSLKLQFVSPEQKVGLIGQDQPSEATVEGWKLREVYGPVAHAHVRPGLGSYQLVIEKQLTFEDDARHWHSVGVDLVRRIERLWGFVHGLPLDSSGFGLKLAVVETPLGWSSNLSEVAGAIDLRNSGLTSGGLRIENRHRSYISQFPLRRLAVAINAYKLASELVYELIDLHFDAHKSSSKNGRAFLFAKALEVVRVLLGGKNDKQRSRSLSPETQEALPITLSNLYSLSNNRRETRHAIRSSSNATLHTGMTSDEYLSFLVGADLVIRDVVSQQLGIETIIIKHGSPNEGS